MSMMDLRGREIAWGVKWVRNGVLDGEEFLGKIPPILMACEMYYIICVQMKQNLELLTSFVSTWFSAYRILLSQPYTAVLFPVISLPFHPHQSIYTFSQLLHLTPLTLIQPDV